MGFCVLAMASHAISREWLPDEMADHADDRELVIEQDLLLSVNRDEVFNLLADLNNYAYFYPLFASFRVGDSYQANDAVLYTDFTASTLQSFGPLYVEEHYYGTLQVDIAASHIQLRLEKPGMTTILDMSVHASALHTRLVVKTTIHAPQSLFNDILHHDLHIPVLHLDVMKTFLEQGTLPAPGSCMSTLYRYCF